MFEVWTFIYQDCFFFTNKAAVTSKAGFLNVLDAVRCFQLGNLERIFFLLDFGCLVVLGAFCE